MEGVGSFQSLNYSLYQSQSYGFSEKKIIFSFCPKIQAFEPPLLLGRAGPFWEEAQRWAVTPLLLCSRPHLSSFFLLRQESGEGLRDELYRYRSQFHGATRMCGRDRCTLNPDQVARALWILPPPSPITKPIGGRILVDQDGCMTLDLQLPVAHLPAGSAVGEASSLITTKRY